MRNCIVFLAAALLAAGSQPARATVQTPSINQVTLSWDSLGAGTEYCILASTNLVTWVTATNTSDTNVSLAIDANSAPLFTLAASNAPPQTITLAWDPSTSGAEVTGYSVYYGGARRTYTNRVDLGLTTTGAISNLTAGATYYFAVTSYTADGLESNFSDEAVWRGALRLRIEKSP